MQNKARLLASKLSSVLVAALALCPMFAGEIRLEQGELLMEGRKTLIRGVGYSPLPLGARPDDPVVPCVYARDLPLIAALGANTVRTYRKLEEGDKAFRSLLETTGLYWLAGFPLDAYYDPSRTLASRSGEILSAFRDYAGRFRGERRLIGYVFGDRVSENYGSKFAGSVTDFYALLGDVARLVGEIEPEDTPLVTTGTGDLAQLRENPPGVSFWLWNAGPRGSLALAIDEIRRSSSKPVLVGEYGVDAAGGEGIQAQVVSELTRQIFNTPALLGGVYAAYLDDYRSPQQYGLFRPVASERAGLDHVLPRAVYHALAGLWEGRVPPGWQANGTPRLDKVAHAASGDDQVAPGTLVRLAGEELDRSEFAANGIPWPLHLGQTCLCMGDQPVPLGMISSEAATALVPWDLPTGDHTALLFRAGAATNLATVEVRPYAPGIFPGAVVRAGSVCRVTAENGVRPGEVLEAYATGLGPGAPSWMTPVISINGAPAEVLYSGTLSNFVGLNQVNLRVHPQTPPGSNSSLELRVDDAVTSYPLSVAGLDDRFGIALAAPSSEVVVQAGGAGAVVEVQAEGRNGYCGPVLLAADGPGGVTFRAPVGSTGQSLPVEIRAAASVPPQTGATLTLHGYAPGADGGSAALRVTVLAGIGDIRVRVVSGGYRATSLARFDWNGRTLFSAAGGGSGRGINVLAVEAATGVFAPVRSFDTWGDETASARLVEYLGGLAAGTLAIFAVADDGSLRLSMQARAAIAALFGSRSIQTLGYQQSWAMISRKGASAPVDEGLSTELQVTLERILTFPQP